jgi:ATP-dependent Clp protease protease subunit
MKRTNDTNNLIEEIHDFCIDTANGQIYLHDNTKEECEDGIDFRVATRFIKNLAILSKEPEVLIHLFSQGGQFDAGMLIYDAISASSMPINILCHGSVMSIATVILQAADERIAMPNCMFMLHEGTEGSEGTHKQAQAWAYICKKQRELMLDIYAEKCKDGEYFKGKSVAVVRNKLATFFKEKEDWYLTAEEALKYGFIDRIVEPNGLTALVQRS